MLLILILATYFFLLVRWSLDDQLGPGLSPGESTIIDQGLTSGGCIKRGWLSGAGVGPCISPTLVYTLQGFYFALTGPRPEVPLLPAFCFYLAALFALFVIGRVLSDRWGSLVAISICLTFDLFAFWPLTSDPVQPIGILLTLTAFAAAWRARPLRRPFLPILAGLCCSFAFHTHYAQVYYFAPLVALLFWRALQGLRDRRKSWLMGVVSAVGFIGGFLVWMGGSLGTMAEFAGMRMTEVSAGEARVLGLPALLKALRVDLDQSILWPPSLLDRSFEPYFALSLLLLTAVASVAIWLVGERKLPFSSRRRGTILALLPPAMALYAFIPMARRYNTGPHHQMILIWLALSAAIPASAALRLLRHRWQRSVVVALVVASSLGFLALQWEQRPGSHIFGRLAVDDILRREANYRRPSCARSRCKLFLDAVYDLQKLIFAYHASSSRDWKRRGFCFGGHLHNCDEAGFPYSMLCRGRPRGDGIRDRVPFWEQEMQWLRWPDTLEISSSNDSFFPLLPIPVTQASNLPSARRCRWMVSLMPDCVEPGSCPEVMKMRRQVGRWRSLWPEARIRRVLDRRIGDGLTFFVWLADRE